MSAFVMIALGRGTPSEMLLMISEKIDAMERANAIIISGGDPSRVVDHYKTVVAANVARLSNRPGSEIYAPGRNQHRR